MREDSRWATRSAWPRRPVTCDRTSSAVLLQVPCAFSFSCSLWTNGVNSFVPIRLSNRLKLAVDARQSFQNLVRTLRPVQRVHPLCAVLVHLDSERRPNPV